MTWFLDRTGDKSPPPLERPLTSTPAQIGAAFSRALIEQDSYQRSARFERQLSIEIIDAIGGPGAIVPQTPEERLRAVDGRTRRDYLLEKASLVAARDPARVGRLPLTAEQFDAEVERRRQAELEEIDALLASGDSQVSQFVGSIAGVMADPINLGLAAFGGSPRMVGRFVMREIALGAGAEAALLPRAIETAEDLDLPEVNAAERIGMGALAGGVFAGAISGAVRGIDYLRLRGRVEGEARPPEQSGIEFESAVDRAEADLRAGVEPREAASEAPQAQGDLTDDQILSRIIGVESGGNATAQNPRSSARGLGQFIESTWLDMIGRHRPDLTSGQSRAQILALRDDPQLNAEMTRLYLQENRARLQAAGVPSDPGALYLAHFMGPGGAVQALRAPATTPITQLMSAAAIRANAPIRHNGKSFAQFTAADLRSWAAAKMGRPVSGNASFGAGTAAAPGGRTFIDMPEGRQRPGMTRFDEVVSPAGTRVPVRYSVVELDSLRAASGQFQPRDRAGRAGSDEQIAEIAARLDAARLLPSPEADRGAPIVGPDGMIESGNGRVGALRRAAELHPDRYDAYVAAIRDAGFDIPADMRRPVLVAERQGDMTPEQRRAWVTENNDTAVMRMSATEQAGRDADFLSQSAFDAYRRGAALNAPEQGEFLRRLLGQMPQAERAAMMTADGRLNVDGVRRVRQALFARAFGAPDLLRILAESPVPELRAMLAMLEDIAPDWAAFRAAIDAGFVRPEFDITDAMLDIVRTVARARTEGREGQSVIGAIRDRLAQSDMFAAPDADLSEAMLAAFYKGERARRPEATGDILRRYVAEAQIAGRADADDLFAAPPSPRDVLARAVENHEARTDFDMAPARAPEAAPQAIPDIRLIDPAKYQEGASSAALVRVADDIEADLRAELEPQRLDDAAAVAPGAADMAAARSEFSAVRDLTIRLDENGPEYRVSDILDDLTRDAELSDAVRTCGLGGGAA